MICDKIFLEIWMRVSLFEFLWIILTADSHSRHVQVWLRSFIRFSEKEQSGCEIIYILIMLNFTTTQSADSLGKSELRAGTFQHRIGKLEGWKKNRTFYFTAYYPRNNIAQLITQEINRKVRNVDRQKKAIKWYSQFRFRRLSIYSFFF